MLSAEVFVSDNNRIVYLLIFTYSSTYVYPTDMYEISKEENGGVNGVFEVPNLCMVTLEGEFQMVRNWGAKCLRNMKKPKLTNGEVYCCS